MGIVLSILVCEGVINTNYVIRFEKKREEFVISKENSALIGSAQSSNLLDL